jgi:myo-inositol 2-dehydrogenase/D-chiro-inositol 1-dehydrogenase
MWGGKWWKTVDVATDGFRASNDELFQISRGRLPREMQTFVAHLGDKSIAIPGIEDGLRAQVMADGAAKSLETGCLSALTSNLPIWVVAV